VNIIDSRSSIWGNGWSLANVQRVWPVTGGVVLELPLGQSLWFAAAGNDGLYNYFTSPPGDFSALKQRILGGVYTRTLKDGTQIKFDSTGKQTQIIDRNGNTLSFGYDGSGKLLTLTDFNNLVTTLAYNTGTGHVTAITDPVSRVTQLGYDGSGRINLLTDPAPGGGVPSPTTGYAYDSSDRLTVLTNPRSYPTTFTYNAAGRVATVQRPDGTTEQLTGLQLNGLATSTAVLAAQAQATYTDPRSNPWTASLDWLGFGQASQAADPLGDMTVTHRDANGLPWLTADPLGRRTRSVFDSKGNPTLLALPDDKTQQYTYNSFSEPTTYTDPNNTTTYTYDGSGNLLSIGEPPPGPVGAGPTIGFTYTAQGFVSTMTDPLSHTTTFAYDSRSRRTTQTDALNHLVTFGYDAASNLTSRTDQRGFTTTLVYDNLGRLTQVLLPDSNPANHPTYTFTYDPAGNRTTVTDPLNHTTTFAYDSMNRLLTITDPLNHTVTYGYDAAENPLTLTDPLGHTTTAAYDTANRLTTITDPLTTATDARNGLTTTSYDLASRLTSITDPVNNVTQYAYDGADRLTTQTDPRNKLTTYSYDAANRLTSVTDRNGRQRTFGYDNADRRTSEVWLDGAGNPLRTMTYNYDGAGQLTSETDPSSTYSYGYDLAGRLQSVDNNGTPGVPRVLLTYGYDAFDNRTTLTDNLNGSISYAYDAANRLTLASMTASAVQGPQVTLGYDAADRLTGITRSVPPGSATVTSVLGYDNADRLTAITHSAGASTLSSYSYSYDPASRLTSYTGPEGSLTYTYDPTNELTNVGGARLETYTYDLNGNRTMTGYQTDTGNRLTSDGTYNYTYDNEGNVATKTRISDGQQSTFSWDYRNRLTEVVVKNGTTTLQDDKFTYDVQDRRIGKWTLSGGQQWTVYDGINPYADFNSGGSLTNRYLYGNAVDFLFARFDGTNTTWYLADNLGSVRQLATTGGTTLDTITYDSYGNVLSETGSGDRFKYTARELDGETGLQYNRARYYDAKTGRWTSQDPLEFAADDSNLYRYVRNNPTNAADPTGLQKVGSFDQLPGHVRVSRRRPKIWPPVEDYAFTTRAGDPKPKIDPKKSDPVVEAGYLMFNPKGALQDAYTKPIDPWDFDGASETRFIAPIYPGRKLYFDARGQYLGGSGPGGQGGFTPQDPNIRPIILKAGMKLRFRGVGEDTGVRGGAFLGILDPNTTRERGEITIVVPPPGK
jgi:RHS repeat-associated protein